jgi:hypothetical protein
VLRTASDPEIRGAKAKPKVKAGRSVHEAIFASLAENARAAARISAADRTGAVGAGLLRLRKAMPRIVGQVANLSSRLAICSTALLS